MGLKAKVSQQLLPLFVPVLVLTCLHLPGSQAATSYDVSVSPDDTPAVNEPVTLYCQITDPSGLNVLWQRRSTPSSSDTTIVATTKSDGSCVVTSDNYEWDSCSQPSASSPRDYNLRIKKAGPQDTGYWECKDVGSSESSFIHLQVKVPPKIPVIGGFDNPVADGSPHKLTCDAWQQGVSDTITYTWFKDGVQRSQGFELSFNPVQKSDRGKYQCKAENSGGERESRGKDLIVYYKPDKITFTPASSTQPMGYRETFTCQTTGGKPLDPKLKIFRDRSGTKTEIQSGSGPRLTVDYTMEKADNQAQFYCESSVANFAILTKKSNVNTYNVQFPHTVSLTSDITSAVHEGVKLTLTCETSGGNPGTVSGYEWMKDGQKLTQSSSKEHVIENVTYTDSGRYECTATNYPGGNVSSNITINVQYAPKWDPGYLKVLKGSGRLSENVNLTLHTIANPEVSDVKWYRYYGPSNKSDLGSSRYISGKVDAGTYTLTVKSVTAEDFGQYSADAKNSIGTSTFVFALESPQEPYPPCCLNVTSVTSISVKLEFQAGFFGGAPQLFVIEYRDMEAGYSWLVAMKDIPDPGMGNNVTKKVTNLSPGKRYGFRVFSTNELGRSNYTKIFEVTTKAAPTITDRDITITRSHSTVITVKWSHLNIVATKIEIEYCVVKGSPAVTCHNHTVLDTSSTSTEFEVDAGKQYKYVLKIYDQDDLVFTSGALLSQTVEDLDLAMIGGIAAAGAVILIIIIIIIIVCCVKKRRGKQEKGDIELHRVIIGKPNPGPSSPSIGPKNCHIFAKPHPRNTLQTMYQDSLIEERKRKGKMDIGHLNTGYEDEFLRQDERRRASAPEIRVNGLRNGTGHLGSIDEYKPKTSTGLNNFAYEEVEFNPKTSKPVVKMENGEVPLYAAVDLSKKTSKPKPAVEYAEIDISNKPNPPPGERGIKIENTHAAYAEIDFSEKRNQSTRGSDVPTSHSNPVAAVKPRVKDKPKKKTGLTETFDVPDDKSADTKKPTVKKHSFRKQTKRDRDKAEEDAARGDTHSKPACDEVYANMTSDEPSGDKVYQDIGPPPIPERNKDDD